MAPSLNLLPRGLPTAGKKPDLGNGQIPADKFNNAGFMALFAILGAAMVIGSIYFFFVARNGGFRWRGKQDWDDYKTTVLRRKGPNGTTLSNATKSTKLGGGSVVPKWAKTEYTRSSESSYDHTEQREMEEGKRRETTRADPELQAYKHEKAAKVGGINTSLHGSQWDHSNTDRSDVTGPPASSKKESKKAEKERKVREKAEQKKQAQAAKEEKQTRSKQAPPKRAYHSAAYSFQQGDDAESSIYTANTSHPDHHRAPPSSIRQVSNSYYESYRPGSTHLPPVREQPTPTRTPSRQAHHTAHRFSRDSLPNPSSRQGSPRKHHRSSRSEHSSTAGTSDTGTKVYEHHIPGLSKGEVGFDDSVSQVGNPRRQQHRAPPTSSSGYRRGGTRARDELSEEGL